MCGGTAWCYGYWRGPEGLSPRVRGNHDRQSGEGRRGGVYPRVCGGTLAVVRADLLSEGLSPRVRGNLTSPRCYSKTERSIPACAGEPRPPAPSPRRGEVYPRVCGGTMRRVREQVQVQGLSPRVRGNRRWGAGRAVAVRSIPACAGEPVGARGDRAALPVYPRVCGGTRGIARAELRPLGLSPRVRGNRHGGRAGAGRVGSIPACAGEPVHRCRLHIFDVVYPRVCGGTETCHSRRPCP